MSETMEELQKKKDEAVSSDTVTPVVTEQVTLENYNQYQTNECEDVTEQEVEEEPCPTCEPDPNAIPPKWKQAPVLTAVYASPDETSPMGRVSNGFLNEKTCEYIISVALEYEGTGGSDDVLQERLNEAIEPGIRGLLRFYDKVESEGEGGTVQALMAVASTPEYYIPPKYKLRMKVLVVVPAFNFDQIPDAFEEGLREEIDISSDDIVVSYEPGELHSLLLKTTQTFRLYNFYQARLEKQDAGYVIYKDSGKYFDYGTQRELLRSFLKSINEFLERRKYTKILPDVLGGRNNFIFSSKRVLGNIEFGFTPEYKLKYINLTKKGCVEKDEYPAFRLSFSGLEPWTDPTTMAYIANLRGMEEDIIAREPPSWDDFTIEHTFPDVNITYGYGLAPNAESNENLTNFGCFANDLELNQIGGTLFNGLFSYVDLLAETWNEHLCMTDEQLKELQKKYDEKEEVEKVAEDTSVEEVERDISIWGRWEEVKKEILEGTPALRNFHEDWGSNLLWEKTLNYSGLCGLISLKYNAAKCLMAGLGFEEALESIIKSAINNTNVDDFGRLYSLLPADRQSELTSQVQQILDLDNIEMPWDNSDDSSSSQSELVGDQNSVLGISARATEEIMNAYKETLLDQWNSIADLESLLELMGELPGTELVFSFLQDPDCAIPALKDLPILDWIKTENRDGFCKENNPIAFDYEKFNVFKNTFSRLGKDRFEMMKMVIKEKVRALFVKLMIAIIDQAINAINESVCEQISIVGQLINDGITGDTNTGDPDYLKDLVRDAFCGEDASEEEVDVTIESLFSSVGGTSSVDSEMLNNFVTDISLLITPAEMTELFLGTSSPKAVEGILELVELDYPEMKSMFSGPTHVNNFFKHAGAMMPANIKIKMGDFLSSFPVTGSSASYCSKSPDLQRFKEVRIALLMNKDNTTHEQASDLYCRHIEDIQNDIEDLLNDIPDIPSVFGDGGCSDDTAILPRDPDILSESIGDAVDSLLEGLKNSFDRDLIGRKGFLNMVLSDTYSLPWRRHKRKYNRRRIYVNHPDDWEKQYGDFDGDGTNETLWFGFLGGLLGKMVHGWYPDTVARYLQEKLQEISVAKTGIINNTTFLKYTPTFSTDELGIPIQTSVLIEEKQPDLIIAYRDGKNGQEPNTDKGESIGYNHGFDIEYSNYVPGFESQDICRVKIIDYDTEYDRRKKEDFETTSVICDIYITGSLPTPVYDLLSTFDAQVTPDVECPQENVFAQMLARSVSDSGYLETSTSDIYANINYEATTNQYWRAMANDISAVDADGNYPAGFTFGYNADESLTSDDLTYYDPFIEEPIGSGQFINIRSERDQHYYIDPASLTTYGTYMLNNFGSAGITNEREGAQASSDAGILGISANERVYFLDPATYGGRYSKPPIYIAPRNDAGWLGLAQAMVPEIDGCDPSTPNLIDFSDIKDKVQEIYLTIPDDERLDQDPDCVVQKPYFKIFPRMGAAGVEGSIMATIRVYVVEVMIKAMPIFGKFQAIRNDTIDDVFVEYIISQMETSLKDHGQKIKNPRSLLRGDNYWYAFLEQCVQVYRRKYIAEEIDATSDILIAVENINTKLEEYEIPTDKRFNEDKSSGLTERRTFRRYRHDKIVEFIKDTERDAKTIMKGLIYDQFEFVSGKFQEALTGSDFSPDVSSLDKYLFSSDIQEVVESTADSTGYTPGTFVFERYVRLDPKEASIFPSGLTPPVYSTSGSDHNGDVTNLNVWLDWILNVNVNDPTFAGQYLSSCFGNLTALQDVESGEILSTQGSIGVRYGLRVSYVMDKGSISSTSAISDVITREKAFDLGDCFLVPLASVEIEAQDKILSAVVGEDYDLDCLFDKLISDTNYMLLLKYVIPLPRYLSLLAIYTAKGFLPSIGQILGQNEGVGQFEVLDMLGNVGDRLESWFDIGGDGATNPDGSSAGIPSSEDPNLGIQGEGEWDAECFKARGFTYHDWDQDTFKKTKRSAMWMFRAFWNFREISSIGLNMDLKFDLSKQLRELMNFNLDGVPLKWSLRRRLADRPFDKNDEECE